MPLLELVRRHLKTSLQVFAILAALAGISNVLVMALINNSAGNIENAEDLRTIAMFLLNMGIYVVSQRGLMRLTAQEVENMIRELRIGLVENISRAELLALEQVGRSEILAAMVRDMETLSQSGNMLVVAAQSAIMLVLAMAYVFIINKVAFALSLGFIGCSILLVIRRMGQSRNQLKFVFEQENHLSDSLSDLLDGFKEIKMSGPRRDDVLLEVDFAASRARDIKTAFQVYSNHGYVLSQTLVYLLLGTIVFVVPVFSDQEPATIARTAATMLFIAGPLSFATQSVAIFANANAAAHNIIRLDDLLRSLAHAAPADPERFLPAEFETISFDTVSFTYQDEQTAYPFTVGPLDFSVRRGETLFITGGNGSGKSTVLKLLVGLYYPDRGLVRIDRHALTAETYPAYRDKFSVIFSDYHLFKRLYGLPMPDAQVLDDLCGLLELVDKVKLEDGAFDTLDLSGGQRKRLALLVAMLEDKPILVLDEWAADQDPGFRRKFYRELLPRLKALGKTIVAITHDDRYFDTADRCIALEEGRVVSE